MQIIFGWAILFIVLAVISFLFRLKNKKRTEEKEVLKKRSSLLITLYSDGRSSKIRFIGYSCSDLDFHAIYEPAMGMLILNTNGKHSDYIKFSSILMIQEETLTLDSKGKIVGSSLTSEGDPIRT